MSETCTLVIPPNIQAMMTGVKLARIFPSGTVELEYTDGERESAVLDNEALAKGRNDYFALVSAVQSKRSAKARRVLP